jgi:phasin family protein
MAGLCPAGENARDRVEYLICCSATKSYCKPNRPAYNSIHAALQHETASRQSQRSCFTHFLLTGDIHMLTAEQVLASHKATVETLFGLTTKAFEGVEKLVELNLTASKTALSEAASHSQAVLSVKDAQELLALQASLLQPLAEKTAAYSRHLYDIAQGTSSEFGKAIEGQTAEAQKKIAGLIDSATKNAPAGSESAVAVLKSTVTAANNAFESVQKAVKQASDAAEANFKAVAASAVTAAGNTAAAATKKR